ncbi:MAG: hypothetical protein JWQ97_545 [Phenylobacterium sp.]|nr:hypothetical protein [Phenylobacterium sp.]
MLLFWILGPGLYASMPSDLALACWGDTMRWLVATVPVNARTSV